MWAVLRTRLHDAQMERGERRWERGEGEKKVTGWVYAFFSEKISQSICGWAWEDGMGKRVGKVGGEGSLR